MQFTKYCLNLTFGWECNDTPTALDFLFNFFVEKILLLHLAFSMDRDRFEIKNCVIFNKRNIYFIAHN